MAVQILRWLQAIQSGKKTAVLLSDISSAFDRVHREKLLTKLKRCGLNDVLLNFFADFLNPRDAVVLVDGCASDPFVLSNIVFQCTVLGPFLWNIFCKDISATVVSHVSTVDAHVNAEEKFADDLTITKTNDKNTNHDIIKKDTQEIQTSTHGWGKTSRVAFDASKAEFDIFHHQHAEGHNFRLLGPLIDPKLQMGLAVDNLFRKVKPMARRVLRTHGFYTVQDLMLQYKTHIWGSIEHATPALYHACSSTLSRLDSVQTSSVLHIALSEEEAFLLTITLSLLRSDVT